MFEGGVSEFYILLKHAKESFHNTAVILDCDLATIVTHHNQPVFTKVCASPSRNFLKSVFTSARVEFMGLHVISAESYG